MDIQIRDVKLSDAAGLADIYSYYVTDTAISFEYDAPDAAEFERRIRTVTKRFPYIVAEADGMTVGFAYAHPFIDRAAYAHCAEVTVYISREHMREGIGRALYTELESRLKTMGIKQLYACVASIAHSTYSCFVVLFIKSPQNKKIFLTLSYYIIIK